MTTRVISFHYTLTNKAGEVLDSSRGQDPFPVLEGARSIIPGLESELFKLAVGDKKKIDVPADLAYGPVMEELRITVNRTQLPAEALEPGARLSNGEPNSPVFTVIKIEGDNVQLDGNHPLAGQDLTFDVEIMEIRPATEEEAKHGHAHGPHDHHH